MPRQARKLSEFGYMHLIIRGIGKQIMFEEEADYVSHRGRFVRKTTTRIETKTNHVIAWQ